MDPLLRRANGHHAVTIETATKIARDSAIAAANAVGKNVNAVLKREFDAVAASHHALYAAHVALLARVGEMELREARRWPNRLRAWLRRWRGEAIAQARIQGSATPEQKARIWSLLKGSSLSSTEQERYAAIAVECTEAEADGLVAEIENFIASVARRDALLTAEVPNG